MKEIKQTIIRNLSNLPGWRTKRKIVVIESDDWGSIRMPSHASFEQLQLHGIDLTRGDARRYNLYDNFATYNDLSALFELLGSFRDINNNSAVFTAVSVVANPDFEKIKNNGFHEYFYEPFTYTLKRTAGCENSFDLWKEGIQNRLFVPQFHGREHLNIAVWMRALQQADPFTLDAFNAGCWGFSNQHRLGISYQAAFELEYVEDLESQKKIVRSGLQLFEQLFGYKATFFVPPNGPINNELESVAVGEGIKYMSGSKIQYESLGEGKTLRVFHWLGQKNKYSQRFITRNCFFEPSEKSKDWVDSCLKDIEIAFRWYKPAVISSHRVNYIGALNKSNRDNGLTQLKQLLRSMLKKWPEVEFMTSDQLGDLISKKRQ
ncbi:MAG TPA: hypothetical protein VIK55_07800 [Paludibacter sp.]